jgi:hypothetical protein
MNLKVENLFNNAKLDTDAREDILGGGRRRCGCGCRVIYKLVPVKLIRYICGVKVVYIVYKFKRILRCR